MPQKMVSDELWQIMEQLLPPEPAKPKGGRPRVPARAALSGIIYVLKSGIPWRMLPEEFDCSGVTCWRRLRDWQKAGLWQKLLKTLRGRLGSEGRIDWSRASLDSASIPAKGGGEQTGSNPVDRGRAGTKHHLLVDRKGVPLAGTISAANVHDSKLFEKIIDSVEPIKDRRGRPRKQPEKLHADKGYDYPRCRETLRQRGIKARIARRGVESSQKLGRHRWVVELFFSWLYRFRRLTIRYERRADIHQAFLNLGCALICCNYLSNGN